MSKMREAEKGGVRASGLMTMSPMVAAALAVRLAVIPFLYRDWLDPFVLEHWAFGRVARSLVAGRGFGNVFADTGVPGVRVFAGGSVSAVGDVHTGVDCGSAGAEQRVFGAHLHSGVSSGAPVL
jgi:hypothetical protein